MPTPSKFGSILSTCDDFTRKEGCSIGFHYPLVFEPAICPSRIVTARKWAGYLCSGSLRILSQVCFASEYPLGTTDLISTRPSGTRVCLLQILWRPRMPMVDTSWNATFEQAGRRLDIERVSERSSRKALNWAWIPLMGR